MVKRKNLVFGVITVVLTGSIYFYTQYDTFVDKYRITDDVFQHTYWMNKFHNPNLFPNDIYVEYSRYLRPYGIKFVYFFLTYFYDPILGGKILGFILFCLSGFLIARLGLLRTKNCLYSLLYSLFFSINPEIIPTFTGGLDRAFAFPFLFIFFIALGKKNYKLLSLGIILGSLFYPLLYPLTLGTFLTYLLFKLLKEKRVGLERKEKLYLLWTAILPLFFLAFKALTRPGFLGHLMTKKEMLANPIFYAGGRSNYFPFHPYGYYLHKYLFTDFITTAVIALGFWQIFKNKDWKLPLVTLVASLILFELSKYFFIKLYLPARYPFFLLTFLRILLLSQGTIFILNLTGLRFLKILCLITILLGILSFPQNRIYPGIGNIRLCDENVKKLCKYIKDKPANIFIAAPPYIGDFISTFCEKKVLLKYELTQAWFKNYFKIVSQRTVDFFQAYYADNNEAIRNFILKYNIDYIVVNLKYFQPYILKIKKPYIEPFNQEISRFIDQHKNYVLLNYIRRAEFAAGGLFLIPVRAFFSPPPVAKPSNVFMPYNYHKCQI